MQDDLLAKVREHVRALSNKAWDQLRASQSLRPPLVDSRGMRFGRPQLQFWQDSSGFQVDQPQTLTVFQPFEDGPPLVRKAVWKQSVDLRALQEFSEGRHPRSLAELSPTIEVFDKSIDRSGLEAFLGEAAEFRIPVAWPWAKDRDSLTTDAGLVGFEFFDLPEPQPRIRCAWSMDLPPEWEPVVQWHGRVVQWLETELAG